ncbi:MAG TPA: hypothetical protein VFZ65_06795 [Planctomycetota bacterium]|nr:hypothetical protein [Planctomycetota bacterium]
MDSFELKPLTHAGVPGAIDKAKQYRLLNEPGNAESICRDILLVEPQHKEGTVLLILSLTDRFDRGMAGRYEEAYQLAQSLPDVYERAYFTGIVYERRAKAHLHSHAPQSGLIAYDWLRRAMVQFEEAERLRPAGDDQAILRWNGCVRRLRAHPELRPAGEETGVPPLLGD